MGKMIDILAIAVLIGSWFCRYKLITLLLLFIYAIWKYVEYKNKYIKFGIIIAIITFFILGYFRVLGTIGYAIAAILIIMMSAYVTKESQTVDKTYDLKIENHRDIDNSEQWLRNNIYDYINNKK